MLDYGYTDYRMHVGVLLGGERQETYTLPLEEVVDKDFAHPNCLIIEATKVSQYTAPLGLKELDFFPLNGRVKMITKMPVRLVSLSLLELEKRRSFWMSASARDRCLSRRKLRYPHLQVTSFEIREEGEGADAGQPRRFHAPGIDHHMNGGFLKPRSGSVPST